MKHLCLFVFLFLFVTICAIGQIPTATNIAILKAEDARRYDKALEALLKSPNAQVRSRAAVAAGRIGDDAAITALSALLKENQPPAVHVNAVFAIGEIESIKGADTVLLILRVDDTPSAIRARAVEAAGKIAAANVSDERSKALGAAIISVLESELKTQSKPSVDVILQGLTAVLRARPIGGENVVRRYLAFTDFRVVADALNTLARLRTKVANPDARDLLQTNMDAVVRANAARVLAAAEDKEAVDLLIKAATTDVDSRVRVSAIRALGAIKDVKSADPLLRKGETLVASLQKLYLMPNFVRPAELNEFIEISTALGQILAKSGNARAIALFRDFARIDAFQTAEPYIARVKIGGIKPGAGMGDGVPPPTKWQQYSTLARVIGELSAYEPESDESKKIKDEAPEQLRKLLVPFLDVDAATMPAAVMATPDALQSFARFKTADLGEVARKALQNKDVQIRATAAGILADLPASKENVDALKAAYPASILSDKKYNDASLSILDALYKLDKKASVDTLLLAAIASDYLVRKKAFELLADKDLQQEFPSIGKAMEDATKYKTREVLPYSRVSSTRLGQILSTEPDYRRAALRKNGSVKAVLTTEKGTFTITFLPEDAPLTVDNFIKLARAKYFDGLEVHRVVPNFVMQDGDPRGDGNGGPGWSIRCEVNMVPYERGAVGMALSGKDTGGSQWFVTHSPQPHLDGGYTVFGRVNETDMKVVDNIVRGDKILTVRIIGN